MKSANPSAVTLKFANVPLLSGLAEGEYISAEPMSDLVDSVAGTDGEVAVSVQMDSRWTLTLKLLETSDTNKLVAQFYNLKKRGGAVGFGPLLYKDSDTGEVLIAGDACVMRAPSPTKDKKATTREWKFLLTNAEYEYL
jgi:hypothetical protein